MSRPLEVLRAAALEDARALAQDLVKQGWSVSISTEQAGPGQERIVIQISLPTVAVPAPVEAKEFDWAGGPDAQAVTDD
jgi:hypothetical protein